MVTSPRVTEVANGWEIEWFDNNELKQVFVNKDGATDWPDIQVLCDIVGDIPKKDLPKNWQAMQKLLGCKE